MISIIMPAYNAQKTIRASIQSVLNQSYTHFELIVVDDASCDDTVMIVRKVMQQDKRIKLLCNDKNMGSASSRNHGRAHAEGGYIAFLDSDDIWFPEKLKRQVQILESEQADICYTSYRLIDKESRFLGAVYGVPVNVDYKTLLKENVIGCSTVLMRSDVFHKGALKTEFFHEDYALWLSLLRIGHRAVGIPECFVHYRVGGRSSGKLSAAKNRWHIYRKQEKLGSIESLGYFLCYAVNGVRKNIKCRYRSVIKCKGK